MSCGSAHRFLGNKTMTSNTLPSNFLAKFMIHIGQGCSQRRNSSQKASLALSLVERKSNEFRAVRANYIMESCSMYVPVLTPVLRARNHIRRLEDEPLTVFYTVFSTHISFRKHIIFIYMYVNQRLVC